MMMSEFIERTGFQPTYEEYRKIEDAYYDFDGNKDEFCRKFVAVDGEKKTYATRAVRISELESQLVDREKEHKAEVEKLRKQIDSLTTQLDRELEWKPCDNTGTNMNQVRYDKLSHAGRKLTDQEAKEFIADECGFSAEKITVLHEVKVYEVNKYHLLRESEVYDRAPVYSSSDWNYVRFNCGNFMYEFINGMLQFYCC